MHFFGFLVVGFFFLNALETKFQVKDNTQKKANQMSGKIRMGRWDSITKFLSKDDPNNPEFARVS